MNKIPFLDLVTIHRELKPELMEVASAVLDTAGFIGGPNVAGFEQEFAQYCNTAHCVGVNSGTDALRFTLAAAGVAPGDGVVTVPNTFIATTEAISQVGARPFFVDVDEASYNLDPAALRRFLTTECRWDAGAGELRHTATGVRITGIVPVHLYGQMADMDPILDLAEQFGLVVIEDACQAHGAQYYSKRAQAWLTAGSVGRAAAFSFYPGKNLGACGEGGAVTTSDAELAAMVRKLREHGQSRKYYHEIEGYNGRLDSLQAGFLRVKLRHLPAWTAQRQEAARVYGELLAGSDLRAPAVPETSRPVFHLYVVRVADREAVMKQMEEAGIATGIHYPFPLHLLPPYAHLGYRAGDLPVAERVAPEVLSLPMFPGLARADQERVIAELRRVTSNVEVGAGR